MKHYDYALLKDDDFTFEDMERINRMLKDDARINRKFIMLLNCRTKGFVDYGFKNLGSGSLPDNSKEFFVFGGSKFHVIIFDSIRDNIISFIDKEEIISLANFIF